MVTDRLCLQVDLARVAIKASYVKSRSFRLDDALGKSDYGAIMFELSHWQDSMQDAMLQLNDCVSEFASAHYSGGSDHV